MSAKRVKTRGPDTSAQGVGDERIQLADAGAPRHSRSTFYLTSGEQMELARVAMSPEPARKVALIVEATHRRGRRIGRMLGAGPVALLTGVALITLARPLVLQLLGFALFLGAFLTIIVGGLVLTTPREGVVINRLLIAIREMEKPEVRDDRVASELETAASLIFVHFSAAPLGKRGPWRLRRQRRAAARQAAAAIASYVGLLDRDEPDYNFIADDMRRAILRVAAGRWRQIAELDRATGEPWAPTRMAELRQRFRSVFQQDAAAKVVVAAFSLAAALVALAAVVVRVAIGE